VTISTDPARNPVASPVPSREVTRGYGSATARMAALGSTANTDQPLEASSLEEMPVPAPKSATMSWDVRPSPRTSRTSGG
jgi:hypothetical protein